MFPGKFQRTILGMFSGMFSGGMEHSQEHKYTLRRTHEVFYRARVYTS